MKKTILILSFISLAFISCKQETKNEIKNDYSQIYNSKELLELNNKIKEPKDKYSFYKHLYLVTTFEDLKNSDYKDLTVLKKYSNKTLIELSKIIIDEYTTNGKDENMDSIPSFTGLLTRNQIITKLDSVFSTKKYNLSEVMHETFVGTLNGGTFPETIKDNIITLQRSFGTGASQVYTYVLLENDKVTNLGQVYDYLSKTEYDNLENEIKNVAKNYNGMCSRTGTEITKSVDKYLISFSAYQNEDAGCCPSLSISYETKDFKSVIPNSIKTKIEK
ncbi:hypothetical protein [Flavobacterium covae]|uniref:hypothetical protein n=1 Tax=Flavobacterium covae TaxID=2906076 RepID=UPI00339B31A0